jgi:hypothetical protein
MQGMLADLPLYTGPLLLTVKVFLLMQNASEENSFCSFTLPYRLSLLLSFPLYVDMCSMLLQEGANVNGVDNVGQTALHGIMSAFYPECLKLLLQYGADDSLKDVSIYNIYTFIFITYLKIKMYNILIDLSTRRSVELHTTSQ